MTILSCQKRHHEPHQVPELYQRQDGRPGFFVRTCDGRAQWPYARPKPPPISDPYHHGAYCRQHSVIAVFKGGSVWQAWAGTTITYFDTHTEAITYAQKLAQERKQQHGTR